MFSNTKKTIRVLVFSTVIVVLSGCGWNPFKNLKTGDKNPDPGSIQVDMSKYSCMSEIGKKIDDYMSGRLGEADVTAFCGCVRTALRRFTTIVEGTKSQDYYTPEDLQAFLNRMYLRDQPLTTPFANEIMKIKVLTLGGRLDQISKTEMSGLIDLVTFVENEAISNLPFMDLYGRLPKSSSPRDLRDRFDDLRAQIKVTAQHVADRLRAQNQNYDIDSLHKFINELYKFLRWDQLRPDSKTPEQVIDLVAAHKSIVTGDESLTIRAQNWPILLDSIGSIFSVYLSYEVQLKNVALSHGDGLLALITNFKEATGLLRRIIEQSPQKQISLVATEKMFDAVNDIGLLPAGVRVSSIKETYQYLIQKAFRNLTSTPRNGNVTGLTTQELYVIESEFDQWAEGQRYLSDNALRILRMGYNNAPVLGDLLNKFLESFDFRKLIENGVDARDSRGNEISRIIKAFPPFFKQGDERVYIMPSDRLSEYGVFDGIYNLTHMNVMRGLVRLMIRAAASDDRIDLMASDWEHTGVTEDEMDDFFNHIHNLGVDIKLMDPRKNGVGKRAYGEGKLFTYAGNGINPPNAEKTHLLNFVQTVELLGTIWSGGKVRDQVYKDLLNACPNNDNNSSTLDVFGMLKIDRKCFERHFFDKGLEQFSNLPFLRSDFLGRSSAEKRQIVKDLMQIALSTCSEDRYIELDEIATIGTVLHYLEVIFTVYDHDRNGSLETAEIMKAYKRFHGYLSRQVEGVEHKKESVAMLKAIYVFLVQNGKLPGLLNAVELYYMKSVYFDNNINQYDVDYDKMPSAPKIEIDRVGLLSVLRVLADVSLQGKLEADPQKKLCQLH